MFRLTRPSLSLLLSHCRHITVTHSEWGESELVVLGYVCLSKGLSHKLSSGVCVLKLLALKLWLCAQLLFFKLSPTVCD